MTDQGNTHEHLVAAGAKPSEVSGDRRNNPDALVAAAADRAVPPASHPGEQESPPSPTHVVTTDEVPRLLGVEVGPVEPTIPVQVGQVVLGMAPEASEPFVLPPPGIIAFVLGNRCVWWRFIVSLVVLPIAILIVAVALRVAGVQLDVITVSVTGAATVLGIVARAYLGHRRGTKQSSSSS
jgi:hypothetical protein